MKIITGLEPTLSGPESFAAPRQESAFLLDDAPVRLEPLRVVETWRVTFETAIDTPERPAGTIMSAAIFASRPKITRREVNLELYDGLKHLQEGFLRHELEREGAPDDAVQTKDEIPFRMMTKVTVVWWEVEA